MRKRRPRKSRILVFGAALVVAIFGVLCLCANSCSNSNLPLDSDFEKDSLGFHAYKGTISLTHNPEHVKTGTGALKWHYTIKKEKYRFIVKSDLDPRQFAGKEGFSVWLKSDREGPLLFQLILKGDKAFQFMDPGHPVGTSWSRFDVPFSRFERDPGTTHENDKLQLDQVRALWIIDLSGYYFPELIGERTVFCDDLKLISSFSAPGALPAAAGGASAEAKESTRSALEVIASGPVSARNNLKSDPCVMKDEGIYKMWYGANQKGFGQQIWYAVSRDGIRWDLRPEPVVTAGKEGEWDSCELETPEVVKVEGTYHMWYCGRSKRDPSGGGWSFESAYKMGHATSKDGITWQKDRANPVIRLGDRAKNDWNWAAVAEPAVIYENGVFKMWYVGCNVLEGKAHFHIGHATSRDGSTWVQHSGNPVIASRPAPTDGEYNGYFVPCVFKDGERYVIMYANDTWNGQPVGPIRFATSSDGINWQPGQQEILRKGARWSWSGSGVFGPTAFIEGNKVKLWYAGFSVTTKFSFGIGFTEFDKGALK